MLLFIFPGVMKTLPAGTGLEKQYILLNSSVVCEMKIVNILTSLKNNLLLLSAFRAEV